MLVAWSIAVISLVAFNIWVLGIFKDKRCCRNYKLEQLVKRHIDGLGR